MSLAATIRYRRMRRHARRHPPSNEVRVAVQHPERVRRAKLAALVADAYHPQLQSFCEQVTIILGAPAALVSVIGERDQVIKAGHRLPRQIRIGEAVPVAYAVCAHVIAADDTVHVDDIHHDPVVGGCLAAGVVGAYLGAPIHLDGWPVGALAAIDVCSRQWTDVQRYALERLAEDVTELFERRASPRS